MYVMYNPTRWWQAELTLSWSNDYRSKCCCFYSFYFGDGIAPRTPGESNPTANYYIIQMLICCAALDPSDATVTGRHPVVSLRPPVCIHSVSVESLLTHCQILNMVWTATAHLPYFFITHSVERSLTSHNHQQHLCMMSLAFTPPLLYP